MKIICPTCKTVYNVPDDKIPTGKKLSTKCKECGGKIVIEARVEKAWQTIPEEELAVNKEANAKVKEMLGEMKKFQPERKDIFINTDWGIPENGLPREKANKQDLVLFKKRWVTTEEKKILQKQYVAYMLIRAISVSHIIFIGTAIIAVALESLYNTTIIVLLSISVICFFASIGLWNFKQWARWLSTAFWGTVGLLSFPLAIVAMYYLHNKTARQIFKSM